LNGFLIGIEIFVRLLRFSKVEELTGHPGSEKYVNKAKSHDNSRIGLFPRPNPRLNQSLRNYVYYL
jgi:hypothetical protein